MEISKDVMGEVIRDSPNCLKQLSELLAKRKMETEGILKDAAIPSPTKPRNNANTPRLS
jgi:hypothetical protein